MKLIDKSALVAEIERLREEEYPCDTFEESTGYYNAIDEVSSFLDTLEVKEIPETTHTEYKKIKKLCEIQRYDENGEAYSIMLPNTRLFMNKINDIIDAIDNIDSRLQIMEQKIGE